jgi:hypothetical protein
MRMRASDPPLPWAADPVVATDADVSDDATGRPAAWQTADQDDRKDGP